MKNLSKKARKRLANNMLKESNMSSHMPGEKNKFNASEESNDELAIAALECAETFITVCGLFLKPAIHKQLQELLVRECYSLHNYNTDRSMALLRALEASRKSTSSKVAPPTQYCLQLYSVLLHNSQREISRFSSQALLDIRMHLHCSPPSLNFALEEQPNREKKDDSRKRISDRNRAVLESLLGKERMPTEDLAEEVITIPDEPTAKKSRSDDISEQISLSSDSDSVVISDDSDENQDVEIVIDKHNNEHEVVVIKPVISQQDSNTENNYSKETSGDEVDAIDKDNLTEKDTESPKPADKNKYEAIKSKTIYEAATQLPINNSNDTLDGEKSPVSMEVAYDYPNSRQDKVNVIDKIDDENLPSTNETDDIQITCGQVVKSSQEEWKNKDDDKIIPKENGINKSPEKIVENGKDTGDDKEIESVASKTINEDITVEDMLADFVDEVNEAILTQA